MSDSRLRELEREALQGDEGALAAFGAAILRAKRGRAQRLAPEGEATPGLTACQNKGVHFAFSNGWRVSVQWGPGNYADGMPGGEFGAPMRAERGMWRADNAEVAIFQPTGGFLALGFDDVEGYVSPDDIARLMGVVASLDYDADRGEAQAEICAVLGITPGPGLSLGDDDEED